MDFHPRAHIPVFSRAKILLAMAGVLELKRCLMMLIAPRIFSEVARAPSTSSESIWTLLAPTPNTFVEGATGARLWMFCSSAYMICPPSTYRAQNMTSVLS